MELVLNRVKVLSFQESDLESFHELINNEENLGFLPEIYSPSIEATKEALVSLINEQNSKNPKNYFYKIVDKKTNNLIGMIGYHVISTLNEYKLGSLKFILSPSFRNKGIMSEALNGLLEHAILENYVIKIVANVNKDDEASIKVLKKCRFEKNKEVLEQNSNNIKHIEYKITKPIYLKK